MCVSFWLVEEEEELQLISIYILVGQFWGLCDESRLIERICIIIIIIIIMRR